LEESLSVRRPDIWEIRFRLIRCVRTWDSRPVEEEVDPFSVRCIKIVVREVRDGGY
jgi:hypothetical protein